MGLRESIKAGIYLTKQEAKVWKLHRAGYIQRGIGKQLGITQTRVSLILKQIAKKLGKEAVMYFRGYTKLTEEDFQPIK